MDEAEAKALAAEINGHRDWLAYVEVVNINVRPLRWWVQAHHPGMRSPTRPIATLPIESREDWEAAREKWK